MRCSSSRSITFQVAKGIRFEWLGTVPDTLVPGELLTGTLQFSLDPAWGVPAIDFSAGLPLSPMLIIYDAKSGYTYYPLDLELPGVLRAGERVATAFRFVVPTTLPAGKVRVGFGLQYEGMPPLRGQGALYDLALTRVR